MTAPVRIRGRDISGIAFPLGSDTAQAVQTVQFPPKFQPPDGSTEFNLSFSASVPGGSVKTALFALDGNNNPIVPSAALQLPPGTIARLNNVEIGGDTGPTPGASQLVFSIALDRAGQQAVPGWDGVGLPGRSGVVTVAFEPFTLILTQGTFFGGFVTNLSAGPLYAEMMLTGWYWAQ